jgi:hypothetical protein
VLVAVGAVWMLCQVTVLLAILGYVLGTYAGLLAMVLLKTVAGA